MQHIGAAWEVAVHVVRVEGPGDLSECGGGYRQAFGGVLDELWLERSAITSSARRAVFFALGRHVLYPQLEGGGRLRGQSYREES